MNSNATMHFCYILCNTQNNKSYVGYTTNPVRRLRQHNGIIKGGAKYTRKGGRCWEYFVVVTAEAFDKQTALSLEWHIKHGKNRHGCIGRFENLLHLLQQHPQFREHSYDMYVSSHFTTIVPSTVVDELTQQLVGSHGRYMFHDTLTQLIALYI